MAQSSTALRLQTPTGLAGEGDLAARAHGLAARHGGDNAPEILRSAIFEEFPGRIALVSSFGAESAVLLHLVAQIAPATPVLFLNTGKHFAQTLSYRRRVVQELGLNDVRELHPERDALAARDPAGDLWRADPDACCALRKVLPLEKALAGFDAWITGRKQFHGGLRASLPVFEAAAPFIKVNPIVRWAPADIAAYAERYGLPSHPLVEQGFSFDRMLALHASGRPERGFARRTLARRGQDRVRHSPDRRAPLAPSRTGFSRAC